jgi:hypothetical protein
LADQLIGPESAQNGHQEALAVAIALAARREELANFRCTQTAQARVLPANCETWSLKSNAINTEIAYAQAICWNCRLPGKSTIASVLPDPALCHIALRSKCELRIIRESRFSAIPCNHWAHLWLQYRPQSPLPATCLAI